MTSHGYEGTSIVDLTNALRITPQSLYAAFGSKEALYRESVAMYRENVGSKGSRLLAEEKQVVPALEGILNAAIVALTRSDRPRGCMISLGTLRCADEHRDIAGYLAALRAETTGLLRARIEQGKRDGQLRTDVDPLALSAFISAILQGMSVQARDGADRATLSGIAKLAIDEINRHRMNVSV